jgi:hypothetical protein
MAAKPETVFRKRVRKDLKALVAQGLPLFIMPIQQKAIKGDPDFALCANGHFIGLELKSEDGTLDALQEAKRTAILEAGGLSLVAYPSNWENVLSTIMWYLGSEYNECSANHEVS